MLLVGGTDPSGGAGLAADIKSVGALGGHGCIAVTAVTVQNSGGVFEWESVPAETIAGQMEAVCNDGRPDAVKSGMLGSREAVASVAEVIRSRLEGVPFVLDPVMVAGSGDGLSEKNLEHSISKDLLPLATLVTPNLDEAEAFTGLPVRTPEQMEKAAGHILDEGPEAVLLKGGHLPGRPMDLLLTREDLHWFKGERTVPGKVHGTGCTLASSCAVLLAAGYGIREATARALEYLRSAIADNVRRELGVLPGHLPGLGQRPVSRDGTAFYRIPRFCPACGGALSAEEPHPVCDRCGLVFYRNPLPAVILVLRKNGRILVATRACAPAKGEPCLPGGFIDLGESPEEAARRELQEETGLRATELRLMDSDRDVTEYGGVVLYVFEILKWSGEPVPSDDVSELEWMEPGDIPGLAFPAHDRVVRKLLKEVTE